MDANLFLVGFLSGTVFGGSIAIKAMRPRRRSSRLIKGRDPVMRQPKTQPVITATPGRDDVVEALKGLGYSKRDAVCCTDACLPNERASVEEWVRHALRYAKEG